MLSLVLLKLFIGALRKLAKIMLHNSLVTDDQLRNLLNNKKPGSKVASNMVCDNLMSLPLTPTVIFSQLSSTILCLDDYSWLSVRLWVQMLSSILSMEPWRSWTFQCVSFLGLIWACLERHRRMSEKWNYLRSILMKIRTGFKSLKILRNQMSWRKLISVVVCSPWCLWGYSLVPSGNWWR